MSYFAHIADAGCNENDEVQLNASLYNGNLVNKVFVNGEQYATFGSSYSHSFPGDQHYNLSVVADDWPTLPFSVGPCFEPTTTTAETTTTTTTVPETTTTTVPETTTTVTETTVVETTTSSPGTTTTTGTPSTTNSVPTTTVVTTNTTQPPRQGLPETGAIYEPFLIVAPVAIILGAIIRRVVRA